jgi:molybdopterin-guanine dinucleotide biosynthesis protein A
VANRLTGVLLVGGASSRFGSPKALARFRGETLAERGWRVLGEACAERLAVGKVADALPLPFPLLDDGSLLRHPAVGLIAGLEAARHDVVVFLPVDCPAVEADDLRALGDACADAAVPVEGDPLPAAFRKSALPALRRRLERQGSIRGVLDELEVRRVSLDRDRLADADTPAELQRLERRGRALDAARGVAEAHRWDASAARIISDWNDTIVDLAPTPVVARVATSTIAEDKEETYAREVSVTGYAARRGAPVVPPLGGPERRHGLVVTLWEYAEELPGELEPRAMAQALQDLHQAIATYPEPLPALDQRLDRAQGVVDAAGGVPRLDEADRQFLSETLAETRAAVAVLGLESRPIHGGPHGSNLLNTPTGPRWIDFDTVCLGPREWDVAHLPAEAVPFLPDVDLDALAIVRRLVSADVAIWCWHGYGRAPEVDEAAHFHLAALR